MANLNSSQWISANISLTGFTRVNAAFMACKELLENSIDATRDVETPRIELSLSLHDEYFRITCADNGRGFASESVDAIHTMFRSSKLGENSASGTGKFGIGLKAMVVMSNLECEGREVSIQSQAKDEESLITFNIGCCELGEVVIKSFKVGTCVDHSEYCTLVTVHAPFMSDCFKDISIYIQELISGCFLSPSLSVTLNLGDQSNVYQYTESPRTFFHKDSLFSGLVSLVPTPVSTIVITRYVNGVPLITSNATESNCTLLSVITDVVRKRASSLGLVFSQPVVPISTSIVQSSLSLSGQPNGCSWGSILIRINLATNSDRLEYTCLSKSALSNKNFDIRRFLHTFLKRMQNKFSTQFQSIESWEHKRALNEYIPMIAKNLTLMIQNSSIEGENWDEIIRKSLSELLNEPLKYFE